MPLLKRREGRDRRLEALNNADKFNGANRVHPMLDRID